MEGTHKRLQNRLVEAFANAAVQRELLINSLVEIAQRIYWAARDEEHFDELFKELLSDIVGPTRLEVESRFWQIVAASKRPKSPPEHFGAWLLD